MTWKMGGAWEEQREQADKSESLRCEWSKKEKIKKMKKKRRSSEREALLHVDSRTVKIDMLYSNGARYRIRTRKSATPGIAE